MADELREQIIEPICEACLPYFCAYWDLPPKKRLVVCKPLRDWTDRIIKLFKSQVEGLTVIGIKCPCERYYRECHCSCDDCKLVRTIREASQAQLQDCKDKLLEGLEG